MAMDGTGIGFYCLYWLFGILLSLDVYLAPPRCSREALDFPQGRVPCPLLRLEGEEERVCGGS